MPFTPASLRFFRQLAANNNKQWFEAHRDDYEQHVREPMRELVDEMFARFRAFAPEVGGDPKRSMFRINRDIRFSKDKSPYKTHAACWFHHRGATRNVGSEADAGSAGFYFHLEPGGKSMIGAGVWMPPNRGRRRVSAAELWACRLPQFCGGWHGGQVEGGDLIVLTPQGLRPEVLVLAARMVAASTAHSKKSPRPQLNRIRDSIAEKPDPFLTVARGLPSRSLAYRATVD